MWPVKTLNRNLAAAIDYAARAWPVIPLHWPRISSSRTGCSCGKLNCGKSIGKHPLEKLVPNGRNDGTSGADLICQWWERFPGANVGVLTGLESGMVGVDVDPRNNGDISLAQHIASYGELPPTPTADTGSGGSHYLFQRPDAPIITGKDKLGPGLDVKGDGGYIVAAPSLHACADYYTWRTHPDDVPLAPMPKWMLAILAPPKPKLPRFRVINRDAGDDSTRRCMSYLSRCPDAVSGQGGHDATLHAACEAFRFGLLDPEVWHVLEWWNSSKCRPPWSERELAHKLDDARKKVEGTGDFGKRLRVDHPAKGRAS